MNLCTHRRPSKKPPRSRPDRDASTIHPVDAARGTRVGIMSALLRAARASGALRAATRDFDALAKARPSSARSNVPPRAPVAFALAPFDERANALTNERAVIAPFPLLLRRPRARARSASARSTTAAWASRSRRTARRRPRCAIERPIDRSSRAPPLASIDARASRTEKKNPTPPRASSSSD